MFRIFGVAIFSLMLSCTTVGITRQYGIKERVKEKRGCRILDSLVIHNPLGGVHKEVWYECWCKEEKEKLECHK